MTTMMNFDNFEFDYVPFPMGIAQNAFDPALYEEIVSAFPPLNVMQDTGHGGKEGSKYSLSELNKPEVYKNFVSSRPGLRDFHAYIKSDKFIDEVLAMLKTNGINLRLGNVNPSNRTLARIVYGALRNQQLPIFPPKVKARFEFSALPVESGAVYPHTDSPAKIINFVVPIYKEGEWPDETQGGTSSLAPKVPKDNFNYENRTIPFENVELVKTYLFKRNSALIFVKTFNSLHGVFPLTGFPSGLIRRTLTIQLIKS